MSRTGFIALLIASAAVLPAEDAPVSHSLMMQQPAKFNAALTAFLEKHELAGK